jgi:hypothetical protein
MVNRVPMPYRFFVLAVVLSLAAAWAVPAYADRWIIECVDCPKSFYGMSDRSLALDAAGHPHIAYGGNHLYYAWHDGTSWHYETADSSPGVGAFASLALDQEGYPHISYMDGTNMDVKYAYKDAAGWHVETAFSDGQIGYFTSLALDADGHPHISYAYWLGSLYYAYKDESGWHRENPVPGIQVDDTSLSLGPDGQPRIAFLDGVGDHLGYAYKDASGWHESELDYVEITEDSVSLVVDSAGKKHITYYDESNYPSGELKYYDNTSATVIESRNGAYFEYSSLALDNSGRPHVSYYDGPDKDLKYAYRDGTGWRITVVDDGDDAGLYSSLALDSSGYAHISYMDGAALKYAHRDSQGWHIEVVDHSSQPGSASLALDSQGHIAYQDGYPAYDLKYAHRDAAGWHTEVVDTEGDTGWSPSLALDSSGFPHIGYNDSTNEVLKYAYLDGTGWHLQLVGSSFYESSSLALDGNDTPHIAYAAPSGLIYASLGASGWLSTNVVSTAWGEGTMFPSLALDAGGSPHILFYIYRSSNNHSLDYAYLDGGGWHVETVETMAAILAVPWLALDSDGAPHIAYAFNGAQGSPPPELRYAYRDGSGWHTEFVDNEVADPFLDLDAAGYRRIAYGNKYAYQDDGGWHISVVDEDAGYARSLVLDENDTPHIAYGNGYDLRYAFQFGWGYSVYLPTVGKRN